MRDVNATTKARAFLAARVQDTDAPAQMTTALTQEGDAADVVTVTPIKKAARETTASAGAGTSLVEDVGMPVKAVMRGPEANAPIKKCADIPVGETAVAKAEGNTTPDQETGTCPDPKGTNGMFLILGL